MSGLERALLQRVLNQDPIRIHELVAVPIVLRIVEQCRAAGLVEIDPGVWCPTLRTAEWVEAVTVVHGIDQPAPPVVRY